MNLKNKDFHIIPSGDTQLVVVYEDNFMDCFAKSKLPENPLLGPFKSYRIFKAMGKVGVFIIVFKPLGITLLLNDSITNIREEFVSSELLSKHIITLKNKLLEAYDTKSRVKIADQELINFYFNNNFSRIRIPIDAIIDYINYFKGVININSLAAEFNCSVSKLERNFRELSGLTPKSYARLIRLRNAIRLATKYDDLSDVIYSLGYFDQSHFIKEFKSFVGESPLKFINSDINYKKQFYKENTKERISL